MSVQIEPALKTKDGQVLGVVHLAILRPDDGTASLDDPVLANCEVIHDKVIPYTDCPVAKDWTLMRESSRCNCGFVKGWHDKLTCIGKLSTQRPPIPSSAQLVREWSED